MGIIDYQLKERIEGQNSRITLSGSTSWAEVRSGAILNEDLSTSLGHVLR